MTPPRSVLSTWRASAAAERLRAEFDRHINDLESLSTVVLAECRRLEDGGWQGAAFDAVLTHVETTHRHNRLLCERAAVLRDAGVRALSDLHHTALVLLDYVADAEDAGCVVDENWRVSAETVHLTSEWGEVIAEAAAAVARADERGRATIRAALDELNQLAVLFAFPALPERANGDDPRKSGNGPSPSASEQTGTTSEGVPATGEGENAPWPAAGGQAGTPSPNGAGTEAAGEGESPPLSSVVDEAGTPSPNGADTEVAGEEENAPSPSAGEQMKTTSLDAPDGEGADGEAETRCAGTTADGEESEQAATQPAEDGAGEGEGEPTVPDLPVLEPPPLDGISVEQLTAIMPGLPTDLAERYLPALNAALWEGEITTRLRRAAFLAQLAHESGQLRYFEELGDDEYFRQYDPDGANPAAGNTEPGDGPRYHGRGPIQLTGRANYREAGAALGLDLEGDPELAARPDIGFRIAQWYWNSRDLNQLADAADFVAITRAINGGYHGLADREAYYYRALEVLR
ncbi:glycoside hydrolase family 19 protein [Nocardia sp. NPDC004068]|uniref:glycoside hydrolase family 19 protein n=1 Tax=Nocardia sp. NPDC004068 TaxID=3364303 RepID=UPI0036A2187D